jgi:GTP-binding protein LepA
VDRVRNFSIIAHIDHGKSTLADRIIQSTGLVPDRQFRDQFLDNLDIERERGITIKSQTVNLPYRARDGLDYQLNLIDTPGHVDFSYEVSRALASCEGVLLLVDATQGVQAQTLANLYLAMEHNLEILPVINKIDLPSADIDGAREQITRDLGLDGQSALLVSAKQGLGIDELLEAVVTRIPAPSGSPDDPTQALIFDAQYDSFRGSVVTCRVFDGVLRPGDQIRMMHSGRVFKIEELGLFRLQREPCAELSAGSVGYLVAGIKTVADTRVGDTITREDNPAPVPVHGFKDSKPVVFSSLYPVSSDDYKDLSDSLERYRLNDASLIYTKDSSTALGQGFRCGFLGLLHLEIVQERLEREFDQSLILTAPSVEYHFFLRDGTERVVDNPAHYPDPVEIARAEEPFIRATIMTPDRYMGAIMKLCLERRGENSQVNYLAPGRLEIQFDMPLAEVVFDFYDRLKSVTQGYGSFDYEMLDYRPSDLVRLDILVNSERVDALSMIVHRDRARVRAVQACERLRDEIPRQQYKVPIQGAIGGHIIARETITAFRKDVTAKCYGGDVSRKRKLLEKQRAGKKRMKMVGNIEIPQSAFIAVLKSSDDD